MRCLKSQDSPREDSITGLRYGCEAILRGYLFPGQLLRTPGGSIHRVHDRSAETAALQDMQPCDGCAAGGGDLVAQLRRVFTGFSQHAGCAEHRLHCQFGRDVSCQTVFDPGIRERFNKSKHIGRAAAGKSGHRVHLFFIHPHYQSRSGKDGFHAIKICCGGVLSGTDGWMFYTAAQMVEHYRGALPLSAANLNDWQKLLEQRRDWLAQRGIKYIFVIAPDKQTIYPEYLPAWLRPLSGQTKMDQLIAHLQAHSTVPMFDLRPILLAAKKSAPLYQKTDTHWNEVGGFVAGAAVLRALAEKQLPELPQLAAEDFEITNRRAPGGDMARSLGVSMTESNAFFFTPKATLPAVEIFVPTGEHLKDLATAKNPQGHGRAMIYHDSFGRYWVPFFGYPFGEADFYWKYQLDAALIERQKPTVVISEMLEHFFNTADPKELSALDALP